MPYLVLYLLKVNVVLVVFYLAWRFVLRPLTFYRLNRIFLVFGILFSALYPFADLSWVLQSHPDVSTRLVAVIPEWPSALASTTQANAASESGLPWGWEIALWIFWVGVASMGLRFALQLVSLIRLHHKSVVREWNGQRFRDVSEPVNPFSFLGNIYLHSGFLQPAEMRSILEHEAVHVRQWHSSDVLLSELSTIFYWFNPGAWLMKNAVKENLEFITDEAVLRQGADRKSYQYALLRIASRQQPTPLVNHFSLTTLKNRIVMMNKKRSSSLHFTRYALVLPLVVLLAMIFTFSKAQFRIDAAPRLLSGVRVQLQRAAEEVQHTLTQVPDTKKARISNRATTVRGAEGRPAISGSGASAFRDTVQYIVNGRLAPDIRSVSADDVAQVQVVRGEVAAEVFGSEYARGAVFVVTKGNEHLPLVEETRRKLEFLARSVPMDSIRVINIRTRSAILADTSSAANAADVPVRAGIAGEGEKVRIVVGRRIGGGNLTNVRPGGTVEGRPLTEVIVQGKRSSAGESPKPQLLPGEALQ